MNNLIHARVRIHVKIQSELKLKTVSTLLYYDLQHDIWDYIGNTIRPLNLIGVGR